MKVVQINATCGIGSTGRICEGISTLLSAGGIENHILFSSRTNGYPLGIRCSGDGYIRSQAIRSRLLGNYGFNSRKASRRMIAELERLKPDIVHLHNIHGHDCDLKLLFSYFREKHIRLVWTFHDCWAFTGYCTYFDLVRCGRWKTGCADCPQRKAYSWFFDRSKWLFSRKKELLSGQDLTIVTPSNWLASLVDQSFLSGYPTTVIHNGIDLGRFSPRQSKFRENHGLLGKYILLGVAMGWETRKGLDVFIELAKRLPEPFRIVLIGTDDRIDRILPDNILSIHRTQSQQELAEVYSAADLFVNPTREENYPTVNMEALACGTPVLTFRTGGSPEIPDASCGCVVDCGDVDAMERQILRIFRERPYSQAQCLTRAREFDQNERFKEYLELYERIIAAGN